MNKFYQFTYINQRENNEDCCLCYTLKVKEKEYSLLLLSDGMGGHEYGEIISNTAISLMAELITRSLLQGAIIPELEYVKIENDLEKIIFQAIQVTNHKIKQMIENNKWKGGGATLISVIISDNKYYWCSLGDSHLYHYDYESSSLKRIGSDHNIPGVLLKEGAITPQIAKHHAQKNQLVYYVGTEKLPSLKQMEYIGQGQLKKNDLLLLFSDGITNKMDHQNLERSLKELDYSKISKIIKHISESAQEKGEKDNQTCVAFFNDCDLKKDDAVNDTEKILHEEKDYSKATEDDSISEKLEYEKRNNEENIGKITDPDLEVQDVERPKCPVNMDEIEKNKAKNFQKNPAI